MSEPQEEQKEKTAPESPDQDQEAKSPVPESREKAIEENPQDSKPLHRFSSERKKILLVDDDPSIRKMLKLMLKDANFDFVEASSGHECLKMLASSPKVDLGLIDFDMPNLNGVQLIQLIRQQESYVKTPFIMVSAKSDKQTILQAIHAGAKDYVVKPFDKKALISKILTQLKIAPEEL